MTLASSPAPFCSGARDAVRDSWTFAIVVRVQRTLLRMRRGVQACDAPQRAMKDDAATGPGLANPVYPDLVDRLAEPAAVPDPAIRFVLAVCSSYAYGDAATVATTMDRLGLTRNRCRMISEYVDALFLTSVAYLIQSYDGRVAILCYRGTPPTSAITWLTDFEVEPATIKVPALSANGIGEVHGGFYRNVRSTRFKIAELLREAIAGRSVLE